MFFFYLKGLDWAVGGRCFLEVLVLRHSVCHNVFMEAICEQPKASTIFELDSWSIPPLFLFDTQLIICFDLHRYAFTPLIDDSDDEEIEEFIASANLGAVTSWERYFNPKHCKHSDHLCFDIFLFSLLCLYFFIRSWWHEAENIQKWDEWRGEACGHKPSQ